MTGGPPIAAAPFNMPHATPVVGVNGLPGIRFHAQPRNNRIAATSWEMDIRIGSAGMLASRYNVLSQASTSLLFRIL